MQFYKHITDTTLWTHSSSSLIMMKLNLCSYMLEIQKIFVFINSSSKKGIMNENILNFSLSCNLL